MRSFDVIVLGAGVVGVSTAIQLQRFGMKVALVDRRDPGEETSFGNSGIIQREGVHPYVFPRDPGKLFAYALNLKPEARWRLRSVPAIAPFLWRHFRATGPAGARRTFEANLPLFARCLETHGEIAREAGCEALIARKGWLTVYRRPDGVAGRRRELTELQDLGMDAVEIGAAELAKLEPDIAPGRFAAAIHYRDPWTVNDPGALVKAYAGWFRKSGGTFHNGDAATTRRDAGKWWVATSAGDLLAEKIVVALGPWSKRFLDSFGLRLPMGLKRGYHRHFRSLGEARLRHPVHDSDNGFVLAPMTVGVRLTTGAEFAALEAPPRPDQIDQCLPIARQWFALGEPADASPWLGSRPVMPDMLPVIGPAPGLAGMWLHFGHAHHGLTLGPATGLLLAQMIAGQTPYCDPAPYSATRFLS
jgi:D-amino-acid dehydrogenase